MKIIISSYVDDDGNFPSHLKHCETRFKELNIEYEVFKCKTNKEVKATHRPWYNVLEILLSNIDYQEGIFLCEDDVYLNDDVDLLSIYEKYKNENTIIRCGYLRKTKQLLIGAQVVFIPNVSNLYKIMEKLKPKVIDYFYSNCKSFNEIILEKSICKEIEHYSNMINDVRKGIKLEMEEVELKPTKVVKLKMKSPYEELHTAIDEIINMIDMDLYQDVFEFAGCIGDPPELLVKGDYVDKVYFLETLLLYLTEQPNSKIILYEDTKKKIDKTFCSSKVKTI